MFHKFLMTTGVLIFLVTAGFIGLGALGMIMLTPIILTGLFVSLAAWLISCFVDSVSDTKNKVADKLSGDICTFSLVDLEPGKDFEFTSPNDGQTGELLFRNFKYAHVKTDDYFILPSGLSSARYRVKGIDFPRYYGKFIRFELEFAPRTQADMKLGLNLPI